MPTDYEACICGPDHTGEDIIERPDCPYHNPPEPEPAEAEMNGLYRERAHLIAVLATHHPAVIVPAGDPDWPDYALIYLDTPAGQISWHIHPLDLGVIRGALTVTADDPRATWDGHDKETALARLAKLAARTQDRLHLRSHQTIHGGDHHGEHYCLSCSRLVDGDMVYVPYPCPTVCAIQSELGATGG